MKRQREKKLVYCCKLEEMKINFGPEPVTMVLRGRSEDAPPHKGIGDMFYTALAAEMPCAFPLSFPVFKFLRNIGRKAQLHGSPEVELRFRPWILLFKCCTGGPDLSSHLTVSILCLSLVMASGDSFLLPIASWHLYCYVIHIGE
jgi:hypothetical protein